MTQPDYVDVPITLPPGLTLGDVLRWGRSMGYDTTTDFTKTPPLITFAPNGPERVIEPNIGYVRMWEE